MIEHATYDVICEAAMTLLITKSYRDKRVMSHCVIVGNSLVALGIITLMQENDN